MPKKISADISPQFRGRLLRALTYARNALLEKNNRLWESYSSDPEFYFKKPPPECSKISDHIGIIGGLIVGIEKEVKNKENRQYQAKRREMKKSEEEND